MLVGIFRSSPFLVTTYDDFINSFLVPYPIVNINHFAGFLIVLNTKWHYCIDYIILVLTQTLFS